MNSDGSELRKLTSVNGFAWHLAPRWSHDGKYIAFHAQQKTGADPQLYVVSTADGDPVGLGLGGVPSWTADDKQIVFSIPPPLSGRNGRTGMLPPPRDSANKEGCWIMNADGNGRVRLTDGYRAICSPDGRRIAYLNSAGGDSLINTGIYAYDLVSGESKPVLKEPKLSIRSFAWSPDSKQLCLIGKRAGASTGELAFLDAGSSEGSYQSKPVKIGPEVSWAPRARILVAGWGPQTGGFYSVNPSSDDEPVLILSQNGDYAGADWSPDAKQIVFSYNPPRNQVVNAGRRAARPAMN
jgi:Tol biopolymer transport system component